MSRIHIIYNSNSSKTTELYQLCMEILSSGHRLSLFKTKKEGDAKEEAKRRCDSFDVDLLLSFGGDGTLHEVINGMMQTENRIPISVYGGGTANDFATYLGIPSNPSTYVKNLNAWQKHNIDLGKANDHYFINVLACGVISSVAHKANPQLKNKVGNLAYYIEAIREISTGAIDEQNITLTSQDLTYQGDYLLLIVANSASVGGFRKLNPHASIQDGHFNCLIIKKAPLPDALEILIGLNDGKHVYNHYVEYFETSSLHLETKDDLDLDGESFDVDCVDIDILQGEITMIY